MAGDVEAETKIPRVWRGEIERSGNGTGAGSTAARAI